MNKSLASPVFLGVLLRSGVALAAAPEPPARPVPVCNEAKPGGPGDVVRAYYAAFPAEGSAAVMAAPEEAPERFFDEGLTRLLLRDLECRERTGEYCWLTVDPTYAAQDAQITELRFCASSSGPEWIDVRFRNFGKDEVIPYRLAKTKAGWRIADQVFEGGATLVGVLSTPIEGAPR